MKVCPICESKCFDDMEVCFGCMHRFGQEPPKGLAADDDPVMMRAAHAAPPAPAAFADAVGSGEGDEFVDAPAKVPAEMLAIPMATMVEQASRAMREGSDAAIVQNASGELDVPCEQAVEEGTSGAPVRVGVREAAFGQENDLKLANPLAGYQLVLGLVPLREGERPVPLTMWQA